MLSFYDYMYGDCDCFYLDEGKKDKHKSQNVTYYSPKAACIPDARNANVKITFAIPHAFERMTYRDKGKEPGTYIERYDIEMVKNEVIKLLRLEEIQCKTLNAMIQTCSVDAIMKSIMDNKGKTKKAVYVRSSRDTHKYCTSQFAVQTSERDKNNDLSIMYSVRNLGDQKSWEFHVKTIFIGKNEDGSDYEFSKDDRVFLLDRSGPDGDGWGDPRIGMNESHVMTFESFISRML